MKPITEYIQKKHVNTSKPLDGDRVISMTDCKTIQDLADIFGTNINIAKSVEIKLLKEFLKGKTHQNGITLAFDNTGKNYYPYYHIHRYEDMHNLTFSVTGTPTIEWPNDPSYWKKHKLLFSDINDRSSMQDIFEKFVMNLSKNLNVLMVK